MESGTPPLTVFVMRVAVADVALDRKQSEIVAGLVRESEAWMHPIDDARAVFIETMVRAVEDRRFSGASATAAADRVVHASEDAAPHLDAELAQLHRLLEPWQRRALASAVRARFRAWSGEWSAMSPADHPWLDSIGTDKLGTEAALVDDATTTARHWVDSALAEVRAKAELPTFDDDARRDLVTRLRGGDFADLGGGAASR